MSRFNRLLKALGVVGKKAEPVLEKTKTLIPEEKTLGLEALKAEDKILTEKARLKYLNDRGIKEGSVDQILKAPFTIKDPAERDYWTKWHRDAAERNKVLEAQEKDPVWQKAKENIEESKKGRFGSYYKDWDPKGPTSQEIKELAKKDFELGKKEGVTDIDVSSFLKSLSPEKKTAAAIAATTGATALSPDEAEAGVFGSAAARRKILKETEKVMDAWTSGKKGASGGRELRDVLATQLDLDPTGAARKEALRRLTARTEVRKNPITGEHEFKVYRGDVKDRFGESSQSFTTDPSIAQEFADARGGNVKEVWLPASKVGSIPGLMKEGEFLSSEKEIISKPFKGESSPYIPKEETLHERISKRGTPKSLQEDPDDFISEMMSAGSGKKAAGLAAAGGAGVAALSGKEAQADQGIQISRNDPEFSGKETTFDQPYQAPAWLKSPKEVGKAALETGMGALETIDKYTGRPTRAALLAALESKNPLTAAKESITEDKDTEGKEVARAFLKRVEESGMPLRAPGQEEYPLEPILGTGIDFVADPTNLAGIGLGTKVGKGFSKIRGLVK